jgi:iron complex outermembrane receptor protein
MHIAGHILRTHLTLAALLAAVAAPPPSRAEEPTPTADASEAQPPAATPEEAPPPTAVPEVSPPAASQVPADPQAAVAPPPAAQKAPLGEDIVVTATRSPRPVRDVPAAVTVVPRAEIERSPAKTSDELLMTIPSFDLFRRSSSLAADPSSQGVKLRGIGGTAAARVLVLLDGVPVNDPFAGWVAWRAFPSLGLERVEVVPGGGAALYGNYALGGVIQLISRPITPQTAAAEVEGGSFATDRFEAHASDRHGPVGVAVDTELFGSDGYKVVAPSSRGPIDQATPSRHAAVNARVEVEARRDLTLTLRGGYFFQDANLGTTYTTATVHRAELSGAAVWNAGQAGSLALTLFGHSGDFKQGRARVATGRISEVESGHQDVPTDDVGASLLWQGRPLQLGGTHAPSVGVDARWISGTTDEHLFPPGTDPTSVMQRVARGQQRAYGVFAQDVYDLSEAVEATLALRYDYWSNLSADRNQLLRDGSTTVTAFPDRTDGQLDPKLGVRVRALDWLTLRGSAYRAFRAPTLDELYRPFQVGAVLTQSNENLQAETLTGGDAGFEVSPGGGVAVRATGFWNELEHPVTNVTIGTNLRQKQNLGKARIRGIEASGDWRFARGWMAGVAYTLIDATVTDAPGNPQLVGKRLAQDPNYRATFSLAYDDPRTFTAGAQVRLLGQEYEDDLNVLPLHEAALVDVFAAWHASRTVDVFLAVNNLLDKTYLVGRSGVDTIGQPLFVHAGLRFQPGR